MEKIKRPAKVSRAEKQVLTPKNEQQNTQAQFEIVYDKVDEIIDKIASGYEGPPGPVGPPGPERTTRTRTDQKESQAKMVLMVKMA